MATTHARALETDVEAVESGARSWLLTVFPHASRTSIFLRALAGTLLILGVEYVVEVLVLDLPYWQSGEFFTDPGVPLAAIGMLFALNTLGQWGAHYIRLWEDVRPAFDVDDTTYRHTVQQALGDVYGRDYVPFALFVAVQLGVYAGYGDQLPAGYLHVGFVHFFAVTAVYYFYRHILAIHDVAELDLADIPRARLTLAAIADFSVVVALNWFAALSALAIYLLRFTSMERGVIQFYSLGLLVLVVIGLLTFVIPVVQLHETLKRAKWRALHAIGTEFETLYRDWEDGTVPGDPSVGFDILESRRQTIQAHSTWPYRLVSVGKLLLGAVVPTLLSAVRTLGLAP